MDTMVEGAVVDGLTPYHGSKMSLKDFVMWAKEKYPDGKLPPVRLRFRNEETRKYLDIPDFVQAFPREITTAGQIPFNVKYNVRYLFGNLVDDVSRFAALRDFFEGRCNRVSFVDTMSNKIEISRDGYPAFESAAAPMATRRAPVDQLADLIRAGLVHTWNPEFDKQRVQGRQSKTYIEETKGGLVHLVLPAMVDRQGKVHRDFVVMAGELRQAPEFIREFGELLLGKRTWMKMDVEKTGPAEYRLKHRLFQNNSD